MTRLTKNDIRKGTKNHANNTNYVYQTATCIICGCELPHHTWKICKSCSDFLKEQAKQYKKKEQA